MNYRYANWSLNRKSPWHLVRTVLGLDLALCGRLHKHPPEWSRPDRPYETNARICPTCDAFVHQEVQTPQPIPNNVRGVHIIVPEVGRTYRGNPNQTKFHARVRSVTRTTANTWVDYDKIDPETGLVWDIDGRRKLHNFQAMYPAPLEGAE